MVGDYKYNTLQEEGNTQTLKFDNNAIFSTSTRAEEFTEIGNIPKANKNDKIKKLNMKINLNRAKANEEKRF